MREFINNYKGFKMRKKATLRLENGMEFHGYSFGCDNLCCGDLVFNTSMAGYPELLTDPAYSGQILCLTYPLVGNYGVPSEILEAEELSRNFESLKIHPAGLVVFDYCEDYSNWEAEKSLEQWMKEQGLPGIFGIDTRELTKLLRDNGPMHGTIIPEGQENKASEAKEERRKAVPADVTCKGVTVYNARPAADVRNANGNKVAVAQGKKIVLVDCGTKHSVIRGLLSRGAEVVRVPYDYDFTSLDYDGVYISDGPGDPAACTETVSIIRKAMENGRPVFGTGFGYLLMAIAAGCRTEMLKRPHRSANQPVRKEGSNRSFITSQNAAYTIDRNRLPSGWEICYTNLNDGAADAIRHKELPFAGAQFNPEVCVGLDEDITLMDNFISSL